MGPLRTVALSILNSFIFYPEPNLVGTPALYGVPYREVRFRAADGPMLHGWFVPGRRLETLLWFHGNAGNISHRLENLALLHQHVGVSVFLFDYRGYGQSEGRPDEKGLYADARAALRTLEGLEGVDPARIVYFGRSLGTAVAIDLALERPPLGLVLESPFTSLRGMAATMVPRPLAALFPEAFDNAGKIPRVSSPVLILHGDRDEIVPYAHARELFARAPEPKWLYTIRGAGHNDTYVVGGSSYFERLVDFLDEIREPPLPGKMS
ncbi:MAG: alpha/beta hydrolase [Candidatus Binatia bacterium]|nr:MAG: alpha/beta hydrolase [Candidatus Binatia bacterium]